jgi:hypothetical protein
MAVVLLIDDLGAVFQSGVQRRRKARMDMEANEGPIAFLLLYGRTEDPQVTFYCCVAEAMRCDGGTCACDVDAVFNDESKEGSELRASLYVDCKTYVVLS